MIIHDPIYGEFKVEAPLVELIGSAPLQRLKGIHQGGASYLVNPKWNVTRYEHSVGVMLLIRRMGGCLKEQIAGLLHDFSHTAFSHVMDLVMNHDEEDFHEVYFEKMILTTEVADILRSHGIWPQDLLPLHQWNLLEQPAPELCMDRIDYTLRDRFHYEQMEEEEIHRFLQSIRVIGDKICVETIEMAEWFVHAYYREVVDFFMDPRNVYASDQLAWVVKLALESGVLHMNDLFTDDEAVLEKIRTSGDRQLIRWLNQIHPGVQVEIGKPGGEGDIHRHFKNRVINPLVYIGKGSTKRASELSERVRKIHLQAEAKFRHGAHVRVISR